MSTKASNQSGSAQETKEKSTQVDEQPIGLIQKLMNWVKAKAWQLGQAALLAYLFIDITCYAVLGLIVRTGFKAMKGIEPWEDPKAFLVAAAATWAGNNATRPFRIAGAAALAPPLEMVLSFVQATLGLSRFFSAIAMLICYGCAALTIMGLWVWFTH
mmetsp:Transcript_4530/g.6345  ORF Transcript_4530/g.6345 Transcript_4530/m.6345 type:complete len:158 (+) Transcript_4530:177-650(+)